MKSIYYKSVLSVVVVLLIVASLYYCSCISYIFFHSLVELFTISIAISVFVIAWTTKSYSHNKYVLLIGLAYLFIAIIDLLHTLVYKGMGLFDKYNAVGYSTQYWIIARYIEATIFLIAPFFIRRKFNVSLFLFLCGFITTLLLYAVFLGKFPITFIEASGLTPFKIVSECIIAIMFLVAILFLYNQRSFFNAHIFKLLVWVLIFKIASEISFSLFTSAYDIFNFIGHFFRMASFFLFYKAIVETNFKQPYTELIKEIEQRNKIENNLLFFKRLLDQTNDGFLIIQAQSGAILDVNSAACSLLGFSSDELKKMTVRDIDLLDFMRELDHSELNKTEKKVFNNQGYEVFFEINFRNVKYEEHDFFLVSIINITERKKTEIRIFESHAQTQRLLENSDRTRRALLSVVEDQKMAKDEIQKLNQTLEQRVADRTAQLEAVNKDLESFTYSVSHDLRAPLRHISGFINLFLQQKTTELTQDELNYLNVVSNSAIEMGELIDGLLTFSRLGRSDINKSELDTNLILSNVLQPFEQELKERNVQLIKVNLLPTKGDMQLIRQVWINLLSNAIKYTRKTEFARIEIGSYIENDETVFYVKDNGAGFNMKYINKLFGVFQRLHKPRDFEGIGIGLANIKQIVVKHGGRCWAIGEVDVGATFYFSLPN